MMDCQEKNAMRFPARIHVLMARNAHNAIVLRRGPSKQTAVIGWNRKTDAFFVGQWLKGRVNAHQCDISPNGRYWIYFAMGRQAQTYTCVAETPFFTALDFYAKGDSWNGGGLFLSNNQYWIHDGGMKHVGKKKLSPLEVLSSHPALLEEDAQHSMPYTIRLKWDGWQAVDPPPSSLRYPPLYFTKRINNHWIIEKIIHREIHSIQGKGFFYEEHCLYHQQAGIRIQCADWEWADVDRNRVVWAEKGRIFAGVVRKQGIDKTTQLIDTNPLQFTTLEAPY